MKQSNTLVSVIVSVYNGQDSIKKSIDSLLRQNYEYLEILIMDDGSSDGSLKTIKLYESQNNNIKVFVNHENIGLTKSLNKLIDLSSGEIIIRHDIDDISKENRISRQVEEFSKNNIDFCLSRATRLDSNSFIPKFSYYLPDKFVLKFKNPFIHGTLAIKKNVLLEIGKYDEDFVYAQDYKLFSDLILKGYKYKVLNESLYLLNMKNNISSKNRIQQNYYAECVQKGLKPEK